MVSEQLVRQCLYNWLGYGNLNSPIWFIGTEEGGAEIWREQTQTHESSLNKRSRFEKSMDFYHVWEQQYGINIEDFRGITVWHYIASFLLSYQNRDRSSWGIRDFVFVDKELGRPKSNHFLCELLPLPKRSKGSIEDYAHIWHSLNHYHSEVLPNRFQLINNTLRGSNEVRLLVSYESALTELMLKNYKGHDQVDCWEYRKQRYRLYKMNLDDDQQVLLLATPFFGQGQISYDGLDFAVEKVRKYL